METATANKEHTLTIGGKITVTGVKQVLSAEDKQVRILLYDKTLTLIGVGFEAEKLSVDEGVFVLSGKVSSLRYGTVKTAMGVLRKLFG